MNRQARRTAAIAVAVAAVSLAALAVYVPVSRSAASDEPASDPPGGIPRPALPDGDLFAWVTLASSRDEDHAVLRIDPAELVTGQEAHDAAVEAGAIDDDEELPNDVFIVNPDSATRTVAVDDTATITVQVAPPSGILTTDTVPADLLDDVFDGVIGDNAVYGLLPGEPLPMRLTIDNGTITAAEHVYLP